MKVINFLFLVFVCLYFCFSLSEDSVSQVNVQKKGYKWLPHIGRLVLCVNLIRKGVEKIYACTEVYNYYKKNKELLHFKYSLTNCLKRSISHNPACLFYYRDLTWLAKKCGIKPSQLLFYEGEFASFSIFDHKGICLDFIFPHSRESFRHCFAHELIHIIKNDTLKSSAAYIIIPLLVITSMYGIPKIIDKYCKNEEQNSFWNKIKRYLKSPLAIAATPLVSYYLIKLFNEYQEIRCDLGGAFLCQSAKGGIEFFSKTWDATPQKLRSTIWNALFGDHPHDKIRIAYLSLWQKLRGWKII